jgi:protein-glutamine gamma-glutamyltransferase
MTNNSYVLKRLRKPRVAATPEPLTLASLNTPFASALERYFQVSLFLLIVTGFTALAGTGRLDWPSTVFVAGALVFRGYLLVRNRDVQIPNRWTNYLTILYVLVFVGDLFVVSGSYVAATVHLVLFSLVIKLFSIQKPRDYVYLAVLSFLAVLAASVLTVSSSFLPIFTVFLLLAINTFIVMEVRRAMIKAVHRGHIPNQRDFSRQVGRWLSLNSLLIMSGIAAFSVVLFFLLPRFSAGYLSAYAPHTEFTTGFSDHVQLGEIGRIQQSNAVVMHVQFDHGEGNLDLRWRGVALNQFDGRSWTNEDPVPEIISDQSPIRSLQIERHNLPQSIRETVQSRLLRYRVIMEPIGTNVLFLAPVPIEVIGKFRNVGIDRNGALVNTDHSRNTESYEALSLTVQPSAEALRQASGDYPTDVKESDLGLPPIDGRIRALARKITADQNTDFDRAAAVEHYLRTNFGYTLQMSDRQTPDPLAEFLFERKQGHCEYFASSMAVMLRSVGVPARIVNGFRTGEYNPLTQNYIIRARDAHSWVEVYLPAVGWTAFDPTPPDPRYASGEMSRLMSYLDAAQEFWREWVINYDFSHQRTLTNTATAQSQRTLWNIGRWTHDTYQRLLANAERLENRVSRAPGWWSTAAIALLALGFALLNLRRMTRAIINIRVARAPASSPRLAAAVWYERMVRSAAKLGYHKQASQTPHEFVETIREESLRRSVENFTRAYERARFGDSPEDAKCLPEIYEQVKGN